MEQTTQRPSHWHTLGWPWISFAVTADGVRLGVHVPGRGEIGLRDLHFWAGMHERVIETACSACRDALRAAMRAFCRERRAEELLEGVPS